MVGQLTSLSILLEPLRANLVIALPIQDRHGKPPMIFGNGFVCCIFPLMKTQICIGVIVKINQSMVMALFGCGFSFEMITPHVLLDVLVCVVLDVK